MVRRNGMPLIGFERCLEGTAAVQVLPWFLLLVNQPGRIFN